jgi:hypothetical protein
MAYGPTLGISALAVALVVYAWRRQVAWPAALGVLLALATWPILFELTGGS